MKPEPSTTDPRARWIWRAVALACLALLLLVNAWRVFAEPWAFRAYPHCLLLSGLRHAQGKPIGLPGGDMPFVIENYDNHVTSPLYAVSNLLAQLFEPSPPWLNLSAVVWLALLFAAAYLAPMRGARESSRLITAVTVSTVPVVLAAGRLLDDHILHMLALVAAAALLTRAGAEKTPRAAWLVFLIPALGLVATHSLTNWLLVMLSIGGGRGRCGGGPLAQPRMAGGGFVRRSRMGHRDRAGGGGGAGSLLPSRAAGRRLPLVHGGRKGLLHRRGMVGTRRWPTRRRFYGAWRDCRTRSRRSSR